MSQASDHDFIINYSFVFRFCYLLFQRAFEEPSHNAIIKHIFQLDRSSLHEYSFHFYDRNCGSEFLMCNILHFLYYSTFFALWEVDSIGSKIVIALSTYSFNN